MSDCPWHFWLQKANWPDESLCPQTTDTHSRSMLVHALRAAMQGAPEWNDHNCKNEAIKRYEQLQKCSISVPEKEDMLRTATGGQKSPQTVMQRVAPVRQGAQRAPIIIKPVPKVHQPSPVPRATQGYAGLRRANVTMPQSPPVTPQQKVTPWLASNGLEPVASQFRPPVTLTYWLTDE